MTKSKKSKFEDAGVQFLRDHGFVVGRMSHNRYTPTGMRGWPDLLVVKDNLFWLVEIKYGSDNLKPNQIEFYEKIEPHLGTNVRYKVVSTHTDFAEIYNEWAILH